MSVENVLVKELVTGCNVKARLKKEIKISNCMIKDIDERGAEIMKELCVHFSITEE